MSWCRSWCFHRSINQSSTQRNVCPVSPLVSLLAGVVPPCAEVNSLHCASLVSKKTSWQLLECAWWRLFLKCVWKRNSCVKVWFSCEGQTHLAYLLFPMSVDFCAVLDQSSKVRFFFLFFSSLLSNTYGALFYRRVTNLRGIPTYRLSE